MYHASYLPPPVRERIVSQLFKGVQEENWFHYFTLIKLPVQMSPLKKDYLYLLNILVIF